MVFRSVEKLCHRVSIIYYFYVVQFSHRGHSITIGPEQLADASSVAVTRFIVYLTVILFYSVNCLLFNVKLAILNIIIRQVYVFS